MKLLTFFKTRATSFRYAFAGIVYVVRTQKNAWIHLLATCLVIITGLVLQVPPLHWPLLIICITLVWITELVNTSIEAIIDLACPTEHCLAKVGKDVSAAAVLIAAISSIVIGLLILGPPLYHFVFN